MEYKSVTNLRWSNAEKTLLDCDVEFTSIGKVSFSASHNDTAPHSVEIFNRAVAGEFGKIADYVPPPPPSVEDRKVARGSDVDSEYNAILKRGVLWNGVRWAATDANRDTLVELHETAQELGQSVTVLDAENSAHTLTAADLSSLRAAGRSYRHAARENRLALHGQIDAATSHAALDGIDVTAGWPT